MADIATLKKFEALSPFEIKDELINLAKATSKRTQIGIPERRSGQSQLGRHHAARRILPAWAIRDHRKQAGDGASRRGRWHARGKRHCRTARSLAGKHMPICRAPSFLSEMVPFAVKKFGFDPDAFVHELVNSIIGDNYPVPDRMLVHNEKDRARISDVGDLRRAAAGRQVRHLCGRGRHGGDVLSLQVAEGQSPAGARRHHRAGERRSSRPTSR